jgi:glutathione S-transferase
LDQVGNKFTYADLSFIPWNLLVPWLKGGEGEKELEKLPHYWAWWQRISTRPAVQKVKKDREDAMAKGH